MAGVKTLLGKRKHGPAFESHTFFVSTVSALDWGISSSSAGGNVSTAYVTG